MKTRSIAISLLTLILLAGCSLPSGTGPTATPTVIPLIFPTQTAVPIQTVTPAVFGTFTPTGVFVPATVPNTGGAVGGTPVPSATFCADPLVAAAIDSFKTALQTSNGPLLAALVSPLRGMEVRYYRDGRTVVYDRTHAEFLFDSTFEVNWGDSPGSGLPTTGAFHEVVAPDLLKLFNAPYTLTCDQLQVGGTTYQADWPYEGNYYSVYYGGTQANGNLDWMTWVLGFEYVSGRPYLFALMPFRWEP